MTYAFNYEGFEKNCIERREEHPGGWDYVQYIFRFDNGYGASIVKMKTSIGNHALSYGAEDDEWELATLYFHSDNNDYEIVYDTEITDDVLGHLTDEDVRYFLKKIKNLTT